jgi:GPH family glycoside/pentoside/hexuronide:cation symporter
VGVAFPLLQAFGFDPKGTDAQGLAGLQGLFVGLPAVLSFIAGGLVLGFPLTPVRHAEIRRQLEALDARAAAKTPDLPVQGAHAPRLAD